MSTSVVDRERPGDVDVAGCSRRLAVASSVLSPPTVPRLFSWGWPGLQRRETCVSYGPDDRRSRARLTSTQGNQHVRHRRCSVQPDPQPSPRRDDRNPPQPTGTDRRRTRRNGRELHGDQFAGRVGGGGGRQRQRQRQRRRRQRRRPRSPPPAAGLHRHRAEHRRHDPRARRVHVGRPGAVGHPLVRRNHLEGGRVEHRRRTGETGGLQPRRHALLPTGRGSPRQSPRSAGAQPRVHRREPDLHRGPGQRDHARRGWQGEGGEGVGRPRRHRGRGGPALRRDVDPRRRLELQPTRSPAPRR
jgi:hypothetical protein